MSIQFFVVADSPMPAILGSHFMRQFDGDIDYKRNKLHLSQGESRVSIPFRRTGITQTLARPLVTTRDHVVPAYTANVAVAVTFADAHGATRHPDEDGLVECAGAHTGAMVRTGIASSDTGELAIHMANPSGRDIHIPKGMTIATFSTGPLKDALLINAAIAEREEDDDISKLEGASLDKEWQKLPHLHKIQLGSLTADQVTMVKRVLIRHERLFCQKEKTVPKGVEPYVIKTTRNPKSQGTRPINPNQRTSLNELTGAQRDKKIIEPSDSWFSSPVILVPKKGGKLRFAIDYRELNKCIEDDKYTIPNVEVSLSALHGNKFYSALDLTDAFWSIPLAKESRPLTAFQTPTGLYQYRFLPQGLKTASAVFCRYMDRMLGSMKWNNVLTYVDDILIFANTFKEHLDVIDKVFAKLSL
jgi:hypothetical protein